jgi:adenine phosphoribosyltransferase
MRVLVCVVTMFDLKQAIADVPDFPRPGILFRDISPLLRDHFGDTVQALDALLTDEEWSGIDALAGIESRGFILGAALAMRRGKGFVLVRKQGKELFVHADSLAMGQYVLACGVGLSGAERRDMCWRPAAR